jgi:hypothetical protein
MSSPTLLSVVRQEATLCPKFRGFCGEEICGYFSA